MHCERTGRSALLLTNNLRRSLFANNNTRGAEEGDRSLLTVVAPALSGSMVKRGGLSLLEIALALVRLDHVASRHRKRGSQHHLSGCKT
jgi:hypothetical protein